MMSVRIIRRFANMQHHRIVFVCSIGAYVLKAVYFVAMLFDNYRAQRRYYFYFDPVVHFITMESALIAVMACDRNIPMFRTATPLNTLIEQAMTVCSTYLFFFIGKSLIDVGRNFQFGFEITVLYSSMLATLYFLHLIIIIYRSRYPSVNTPLLLVQLKIIVWVFLMLLLFCAKFFGLWVYTWYKIITIFFLILALVSPVAQLLVFCILNPLYAAVFRMMVESGM